MVSKLTVTIALTLTMLVSLITSPAFAGVGPGQTCAHGGNPIAVACENGQDGGTYFGGYDNFSDLHMTDSEPSIEQGNHINNEMWFFTHQDESQWVEMGIREGNWPGHGTCNCGYGRFWADFNSAGVEWRHLIAFVDNGNGGNHSYEVIRDTSDTSYWDVYVDYNFISTSRDQNSSTGYEVMMGLEDSDVTPATYADLFNHSPLEYITSDGSFHDFTYQKSWEDYPCSSYPTGYCLHDERNGTDVFEDSKP